MPYLFYDPTFILMIPVLLFTLWAQQRVKSTYKKYSTVDNSRGYTGHDVARQILDENGLNYVQIERIQGNLTDHYDPKANVVRLSDGVYGSQSVAAIGVAAHEVGHAIQHATGYAPVKIRTALVPVTNFGSNIGIWIVFIGIILSMTSLAYFGIILFASATLFQLVTLPVEFNASSRALKTLDSFNILDEDELRGSRKVLNAAALTYVAALAASIITLLRLILRVMLSSNRRDD